VICCARESEFALCEPGTLPLLASGKVDVLPAERGKILEQLGIESLPVVS
jgi:hypothetical protein